MKKLPSRKLGLAKETLRALTPELLSDVVGGNASAAANACNNRHSFANAVCYSRAAAVTCHRSAAANLCVAPAAVIH
jgi:hypothetical protein